ncbi:MAG TPA: OadG family protein [Thermosynergistes sp.]|nr:OadG family protein [Thermosynergistes sp.]
MVGLASHFESVSGALLLTLISFSTVFIVLVGLTLLIYCVRFLSISKKKEANNGGPGGMSTVEPQTPILPVQPQVPSVQESVAGDELTAVIAAAIASSMGAGAITPKIGVVPSAVIMRFSQWKAAARAEQMEGFED